MHRGDVRRRLGVATGANRGLDEVHEHDEGMRDVRREGSGRADPARLLVGLLEVTPSERGQPAGLRDAPLSGSDTPWSGPLDELVGQHPDPFIVALRRREHDL